MGNVIWVKSLGRGNELTRLAGAKNEGVGDGDDASVGRSGKPPATGGVGDARGDSFKASVDLVDGGRAYGAGARDDETNRDTALESWRLCQRLLVAEAHFVSVASHDTSNDLPGQPTTHIGSSGAHS